MYLTHYKRYIFMLYIMDNINDNKIIIYYKKKDILERNKNINDCDISYLHQLRLINELYINNNNNNELVPIIMRELDRKLLGYKYQDIKKNIYNNLIFIKYDEIIEKLVASKIKCHYCFCNMKIIYKFVRDDNQWTLDRIDNTLGHTKDNTIVCCLKCNLQRRCIDKEKFEFTKKLKIIKNN